MPDTPAIRYHKICMRPAFLQNLYLKSLFAQKNNPYTPRQGITPCHEFIIFSPPVWDGICKDRPHGCLIPYSTLSRCNIPRTPLRLPCSPAEVSLSPGFQDSLPTLPHAGDAAHIFPSSVTIPCSTCLKALSPAPKQANISPRSSPLIIYQCSGCFVSLHTDILFSRYTPAYRYQPVRIHLIII